MIRQERSRRKPRKKGQSVQILYQDEAILLCRKPAGVLSTDEPGGMPSLVRGALDDAQAEVYTVHRLDRVVGGLMLLARSREAAGELSRQIRDGEFEKEYLAVIHGDPGETGALCDLMYRDKARKMSFVTDTPGKGVLEARLRYRRLGTAGDLSLVRIALETGRTHQIRCQFAAHGWELAGERKYSTRGDPWPLALFSCALRFFHPVSGGEMSFTLPPPEAEPWSFFDRVQFE